MRDAGCPFLDSMAQLIRDAGCQSPTVDYYLISDAGCGLLDSRKHKNGNARLCPPQLSLTAEVLTKVVAKADAGF